jgi:hypothetical protein
MRCDRGGGPSKDLKGPPHLGHHPRPARAHEAPRSSPLFGPRPQSTWVSRQTARQVVNSNCRRAVTPASFGGAACLMELFFFLGGFWGVLVFKRPERNAAATNQSASNGDQARNHCLTTPRANGCLAATNPAGNTRTHAAMEKPNCVRKRRGSVSAEVIPPARCWGACLERAKHCLTRTSARAHHAAR